MANMLLSTVVALVLVGLSLAEDTAAAATTTCDKIIAEGGEANQEKMLLCQLHESASLLAQLGDLVSEGLERVMAEEGLAPASYEYAAGNNGVEKRKHEYLRFGKRKHEYLRFGKRKHEYLRFGKRKHEYLRFGRK